MASWTALCTSPGLDWKCETRLEMKSTRTVCWDVAACSLTEGYRHSSETSVNFTRFHDVSSQKTEFFVVSAVRTWNVTRVNCVLQYIHTVFIVQAYQTSQCVVPRGDMFLGKWRSSFAGSSDGKMNVQSTCALNTRYYPYAFLAILHTCISLAFVPTYFRRISNDTRLFTQQLHCTVTYSFSFYFAKWLIHHIKNLPNKIYSC
jgi:hypothetical protein